MELELTNGEEDMLIDGMSDDVAFNWVLIHLGLESASVPTFETRDRAFTSLNRLLSAGMIRIGRTEATGEMVQVRARQVSKVRFVEEPIDLVRERVDRLCAEPTEGRWGWPEAAWVVSSDAGSEVARSILAERRRVQVRVSDLSRRNVGTVTGVLEIKTPEGSFPAAGWTDFVVPILPMIAGAFEAAHRGTPQSVWFMDGPYAIRFEPVASEVRVLGTMDRPGMRPQQVLESQGPWILWARALVHGCSRAHAALFKLGFTRHDDEVKVLRAAEDRLDEMIEELLA